MFQLTVSCIPHGSGEILRACEKYGGEDEEDESVKRVAARDMDATREGAWARAEFGAGDLEPESVVAALGLVQTHAGHGRR